VTSSAKVGPPALRRLAPRDAADHLDELLARPYAYRDWEDLYRQQWTWDDVVKVSHHRVNCNAQCSFDAYVKDGMVWREEQNATIEQSFADVPDFNPRGCTAGCVYSMQMYDATRVQYPMKRVGERGSGKWKRISWDQALTEISDKLIDVIEEDGSECIMYETVPNADFGIGSPIESHFFSAGLGATTIDIQSAVGDLPTGLIQTWGLYMCEGTADDWFLSDYIVLWITNPNYTRQQDVHFLWEARYRGAKVVSIAPDYSSSTIHADRWLNVRFGTDAALAMGMIGVILDEELYDAEYVVEQTDLPFLVRDDTRRFLRESDVEEGGSDGVFYVWNGVQGSLVKPPGSWDSSAQTLALDASLKPELQGSHSVRLKGGESVVVRPVFELLRQRLAQYPLERVAEITGVPAANIRRVAREFAAAKSAAIHGSWGSCKHYHSNLFQRGMAYLCALTGNSGGRPGTGVKVGALWPPPFIAIVRGGEGGRLAVEPFGGMPVERMDVQQLAKMTLTAAQAGLTGNMIPMIPWLYSHDPKWAEMVTRQEYNDPSLPRPVKQYMEELLEKRWQSVKPAPPKRPRFYYFSGTNPLRRWPNPKVIRESLWASIDMIVACDPRWSTSANWADYVLPACGWYEKPGIKYQMSYLPYVVVGDRAVPPLYESKHEWDIVMLLAKKVQERARARGVQPYTDVYGNKHDLAALYENLTADGVYREGEEGERRALSYIMRNSLLTRESGLGEDAWGEAVETGMVKIEAMQPSALFTGVFSDYTTERPLNSCGWFVNQKFPWPTLTGRQQFYLDHEWFLELGEELITHKEPLAAGGRYPLRFSGGHTRHTMHSVFASNEHLLRMQRGEPVAFMSVADAAERGIEDHDRIRVYNDVGSFELRAKVSNAVPPGMVMVYHAWDGFQFRDWATQNDVVPNPVNPLDLVGGYGHLHHRGASYTMNLLTKEAAVEVEKLEPAP
jgi:DMSO reductase family type II enzyme molybdopterin subunit